MAMSEEEELEMCRQLLRSRPILLPDPPDLPPHGALVRLRAGQTAEVIAWLDTDLDDRSNLADKRLAVVYVIDGYIPGEIQKQIDNRALLGFLPEDEVTLIREQHRPRFAHRYREHMVQ